MTPLAQLGKGHHLPVECGAEDRKILEYIRDHQLTMVSAERLFATLLACRHVVNAALPGDFVECGVWRGGNGILAADIFKRAGQLDRGIWLFDTFDGMVRPGVEDTDGLTGRPALDKFQEHKDWCMATVDEVEANFTNAGVMTSAVRLVVGDVERTLKDPEGYLPKKISVLRLDTDWYASTKIELETLWPRVVPGGFLIVDDYGKWRGSRKAVDEFFGSSRPFFHYIDYTGRMAIKP